MLTRRHIRIKVMQAVYAFMQSEKPDREQQEKLLINSLENMYNLYLSLLSLLIEIHKTAEKQLRLQQKKYLATQEEKNPTRKFITNPIFILLRNDSLTEELKKRKLPDWNVDDRYVQDIYKAILESPPYKKYMNSPAGSFKEDKECVIAIFRDCIAQDDKLYQYLEDYTLTWGDDFPVVNTYLLKMLQKVEPNTPPSYFLVKLYKNEDDKSFGKDLFRKTLLHNQDLQTQIEGKALNWDIERIAAIDLILLKMAVCEFLYFSSIPTKVTMNEYLEIAKEYSTSKSSLFINGILDKLLKEYTAESRLNKAGRGLL